MKPRNVFIFISYSHDSSAHAAEVLRLANQLRRDGVNCWIDQFEPHPSGGWPVWMEQQIEKADYVLLVCTERYLKRFNGKEAESVGLGVAWESILIRNEIYETKGKTQKFIPVGFEDGFQKFIPAPLKGASRFLLGDLLLKNDAGFRQLYALLTAQSTVTAEKLGKKVSVASLPTRDVVPDLSSIAEGSALLLNGLATQAGGQPPRHEVLYAMRYLGFDARRTTIRDYILENHRWLFEKTSESLRSKILHDFQTGLDDLRSPTPAEFVLCVGHPEVGKLGGFTPSGLAPAIWISDLSQLSAFLSDRFQYGLKSQLRRFAVLRHVFVEETSSRTAFRTQEVERTLTLSDVHVLQPPVSVLWTKDSKPRLGSTAIVNPESLEAVLKGAGLRLN